MQLAIQDVKDQKCDYTGNKSKYLIKITEGDQNSGWLCREALEAALRMLNAMEGRIETYAETVPVSQPEEKKRGRRSSAASTSASQPNRDNESKRIYLEALQEDLQTLADNPPAKPNGQPSDQVGEKHIVQVVKRHIKRFRSPNDMFEAVDTVFGLGRGEEGKRRFSLLIQKAKLKDDD